MKDTTETIAGKPDPHVCWMTIRPSVTNDREFIVTRDTDGTSVYENPRPNPFVEYDRLTKKGPWSRVSTIILPGQDPIPTSDWRRLAIARDEWENAEKARKDAEEAERKQRECGRRIRERLSEVGVPGDRAELSDDRSFALVDGLSFHVYADTGVDVLVSLDWECKVCREPVEFPIHGQRDLGAALRAYGFCPVHDPRSAAPATNTSKEDASDVR